MGLNNGVSKAYSSVSTYLYLEEERKEAIKAILGTGYHQIGMEFFPANPATPWEVIERPLSKE